MAFSVGINSANFNNCASWNLQNGNTTSVGTNGGQSAYGTQDQMGNVWEGNESTVDEFSIVGKSLRGGAWNTISADQLSSNFYTSADPAIKSFNIGFRLVNLTNDVIFTSFLGVNDAGNSPDTNGYGAVSYNFNITLNPITNSEYVIFLNTLFSTI